MYGSWSAKDHADEWLVEAWRSKDAKAMRVVEQILQDRYETRLQRFVSEKLPDDLYGFRYESPEDVTQNIWATFYDIINAEPIRDSVRGLLYKIATAERANACRRLYAERGIEIGDLGNLEIAADELRMEHTGELILKHTPYFIQRAFSKLSDCQRVVTVLRGQYGHSSRTTSRLMGKSIGTVDQSYYLAFNEVIKYFQSEEYDVDVANLELSEAAGLPPVQPPDLTVERFAKPITPQLTPDELEPLGIKDVEEFHKHYVASLVLPWQRDEDEMTETERLYVMLVRRGDWGRLLEATKEQLQHHDHSGEPWERYESLLAEFPTEYLLGVEIVDDNIVLTPRSPVGIIPDPLISSDFGVYVSMHSLGRGGRKDRFSAIVDSAFTRLTKKTGEDKQALLDFITDPNDPVWQSEKSRNKDKFYRTYHLRTIRD
jgi:DNA-directed RNA polymerase specialized sigma24 family protein